MFRVAPRSILKDLEKLFQYKVFKMLLSRKKITEDLIEMLLSWRHSGFNLSGSNSPKLASLQLVELGVDTPQLAAGQFIEEWEVHPQTRDEFHEIFDPFKFFVDPWLLLIAEVEGKPAGFCWGMPDLNPLFHPFKGKFGPMQMVKFISKAKTYKRAGLIGIGVLPEYRGTGIAQALAITLYEKFENRGLKEAFYYVVNESNSRSRRFAESLGGTGRVMYHCYDKNL
jgi:ribosomal protein S18 acetylase RimI-like enzyme